LLTITFFLCRIDAQSLLIMKSHRNGNKKLFTIGTTRATYVVLLSILLITKYLRRGHEPCGRNSRQMHRNTILDTPGFTLQSRRPRRERSVICSPNQSLYLAERLSLSLESSRERETYFAVCLALQLESFT
jgi:hypothetical protein